MSRRHRIVAPTAALLLGAIAIACGLDITGVGSSLDAGAAVETGTNDGRADGPVDDGCVSPCVIAVAAEHLQTCAAIRGASPRCWGANDHGELGRADASTVGSGTPLPVELAGAEAVSAGGYVNEHRPIVCATSAGVMSCWGDDSFGQRGRDGGSDAAAARAVPSIVPNVGAVTSVAAGGGHVCAGQSDGGVVCWGLGGSGQLGRAIPNATFASFDPRPTRVALPRPTVAVAAGGFHTCTLLDDGTVDCFGLNNVQQLGRPNVASSVPALVDGLGPVAQLVASYAHTCAVLIDGSMRCWGYNANGQLGQGMTSTAGTPKPVLLPNGRTAKAACSGYAHSCAVLDDGAVACWGYNARGQSGAGSAFADGGITPTVSLQPQVVAGVANVRALTCGGQHTCALHINGSLTCWGSNSRGQLGRGAADPNPHPEPALVVF